MISRVRTPHMRGAPSPDPQWAYKRVGTTQQVVVLPFCRARAWAEDRAHNRGSAKEISNANSMYNGADVRARPLRSFRFGRGRMSRTLPNRGQQSHRRLNTQNLNQHGRAEDLAPYARSGLTRMDACLAFFALEDLARAVLVTCETAMLRGTITRRRWRSRGNRPVGLRRRSSVLNPGTRA
jgi:hypothetical protein